MNRAAPRGSLRRAAGRNDGRRERRAHEPGAAVVVTDQSLSLP